MAEVRGGEAGKHLLNTKRDVEHVRLALCESWSSTRRVFSTPSLKSHVLCSCRQVSSPHGPSRNHLVSGMSRWK